LATTAKLKRLVVGTPQGSAGLIEKESRFVFNYTTREKSCEVSLTMPLRAESYSSGALPNIFEMNRPEGYLLAKIEEAFAKQGGLDDMQLLAIVGGEQIGRLRYTEPASATRRRQGGVGLKEILSRQPTSDLFDFLVATYFESGVSGVQPKVLVPDADRSTPISERTTLTHANLIVKASGDEFPNLTENEFLCLSAAKQAGIEVPAFHLSDNGGLFVSERFDLREGVALGFEDMCVLTGKSSKEKYKSSYELVAKAVQLYCAQSDPVRQLHRLFEYVVLICLVRNGDGHLKNFGLIYDHPDAPESIRLAPLYDVVTTSIYALGSGRSAITKYDRTLALNLSKSKQYPDRRTLMEFGSIHCQVKRPAEVIERISDAMAATLLEYRERVQPRLWQSLKVEWDAGRASVAAPHFLG
jgi:serine/threonine-protein kinase HipA